MQIIGSIIFSLYMSISIIVVTIINLCVFFIPYKKRAFLLLYWAKSLLKVMQISCRIKINIIGLENIPAQPCIVFSKHQSTMETLIIQTLFVPHVWVIKQELMLIPFFGWSVALSEPIPINRKDGKKALKKVIVEGCDRLARNFWVLIFPEGTRTLPGQKVEYKVGGAMLAQRSQSPILPIAHNCGTLWRKGQFIKKSGEITISIGPLIETKGLKAKQILALSSAWIETESSRLLD